MARDHNFALFVRQERFVAQVPMRCLVRRRLPIMPLRSKTIALVSQIRGNCFFQKGDRHGKWQRDRIDGGKLGKRSHAERQTRFGGLLGGMVRPVPPVGTDDRQDRRPVHRKIKVGKLNTDEAPEIAIKYGISAIPQVLLFKGGDQPFDKQIGNQPMDNIVKMINRALEA